MSELTYIAASQITNNTFADELKVNIVKTLARWFPSNYVFNEYALESWVQKEGTNVEVLYSNSFQFELCLTDANDYELTMYSTHRLRRNGSICDFFERVMDNLEFQLKTPDREFVTMIEATRAKAEAKAEAETLLTTEDAGVLSEEEEDEDEAEAEDLEEDEEDEEDEDDIMDMPLSDMTDDQVEEYTEMIGREPRDEINEWSMDYKGGLILRYSYVNFADETVSNQTVSDRTISRARFAGATLRNCVFEQVQFFECDFKSVVLENVTFTNSSFIDCELEPYIVLHNSCHIVNFKDEDEDENY